MSFQNKFSERQNSPFSTLQLEELPLTKFLMERLTDAVFWTTSDARVIYVNYAACHLVGYSYEELLSMTIHDVIPDFPLSVWSNCWKTIKQQGSLYFESLYQTQKDQCLRVEITATYMEYESREYGCILLRDISERNQASFTLQKANQALEWRMEELTMELRDVNEQSSHEKAECNWVNGKQKDSLDLLQATLESTADGVIAIGCDGDIIGFNQKFFQMWQIPDSIAISRDYSQYLNFYSNQIKDSETFCKNIQEFHSKTNFEGCDTLELRDGRIFERYSKPMRLGEQIIGTVCSFRDITERKQAEEEIRQILEQEKQLAEHRAHFVSMVSHELRSPLNIISYSTSLLKRHSHNWNEEKKAQYLQRLQTAVEQISHLMDEVLIIGSAESKKLQCELKPVNLNLFCREILAETKLYSNTLHLVNFVSQGDYKVVWVDKKLLQPILTNLVSNAIKYSPTGSRVDLVLCYEDEQVIFQIKDRGIGISISDQQQLFKPFYRGSNVGNIPGNGLGLAIVKKLVDLHNSQISVVSDLGIGTTFTIILPLGQPG